MKKINRKVVVSNLNFVECPYCAKGEDNQFKRIHWKHLLQHNKTLDEMWEDFPDIPTITKEEYDRQITNAKKGKENFVNNLKNGKTKIVRCYYDNDSDCEHGQKEVPSNYPGFYFCKTCEKLGKENPDGRTKDQANERREKTLTDRYGNGITNANQIPESKVKTKETCDRKYEGIGFAGTSGIKSRNKIKEKYGVENIMKTDEGYEMWQEGIMKSTGYNHPLKNPKTQSKVSLSKTGQPSSLKGKTYDEIHGEEVSKELKEMRKISGAEGYLKSRRISKPQIDLYKLVDSLWDTCMMDYPMLNYYLDISIGELKLDLEYDSTFWHKDNIESDQNRTNQLEKFNWKVIRFIDKIPSKEEIEKIIEDRIIELDNLKSSGIQIEGKNSFEYDYLCVSQTIPLDTFMKKYFILGGNDSELLFKKRILILHKIIDNTYNQASYDDLVNLWYYYIEDKEKADKYLECIK